MNDPSFAAYLLFTTLLVITPGSTTAIVVRNLLRGGRRAGIAAAAGAAFGNATHATASALGLAALFARVPAAFLVLRVLGAMFLAYIGARSLWMAWRAQPPGLPGALERAGNAGSAADSAFAQGLTTNLLNPAVATFYLTVVPSFLPEPLQITPRFVVYAGLQIVMAFLSHSAWVWALDAMRTIWARPAARRALETLTGLALLALAGRVGLG